jgi:hypothetical protein
MIYVCGDIHGEINIHKLNNELWPEQQNLFEDDTLIILGDFGLLWRNDMTKDEKYWMEWLLKKPCNIAFVDGNHENFNIIDACPIEEKWGGYVQPVYTNKSNKSIYRLRRGEVYTIDHFKIFVFGGATSIDKMYRIENISWWPQEIPTYLEFDNAYMNLEKNNFEVDFILSHTAPSSIHADILKSVGFSMKDDKCPVMSMLEKIREKTKFRQWHFGHYHIDNPKAFNEKYFSHYDNKPFLLH